MQKDEEGRKKIKQWTRYATVALAAVQAWGFAIFTESLQGAVANPGFGFRLQMVFFLTTGAMFVMWLGEQITERGLGNGASLMIFFSIVERIWPGICQTFGFVSTGAIGPFSLVVLAHHDGGGGRRGRRRHDGGAAHPDPDPAAHDGARTHARGGAELHPAPHQLGGRDADHLRAVGDRGAGRVRAVHGQRQRRATSPTCSRRARVLLSSCRRS